MQRTMLEKVAGSFNATMEWGSFGALFVFTCATLDLILGGVERYLDSHFLLPLILCSMGFFVLLMLLGFIGICGVKIYCFWTDNTDPTDLT